MNEDSKKFLLQEKEIPEAWYNVVAEMPNKPRPMLNPATKQPLTAEDLFPLFSEEASRQEMNTADTWIEIPEEVRDMYKIWRPTPLVRARGLEKALDTPAHIYFKNESVSPAGSHKPNTAVPQAYYNYKQGIRHLTTETGAGQWGAAIAFAAKHFGLDVQVFMVKVSYEQKPYRRLMMNTWGAECIASPSTITASGRAALERDPDCSGSLGLAISEAVEMALQHPEDTRYCLGSVLNHVILHQTVIGLEAEKQMEMAGEYPDTVIACFGGGSNFGGIAFPFMRHNILEGKKTRFVAAEPASCPKLTRGKFQYDFGDEAGYTPLLPMFTLGHNFSPANIHAGGLRYHGAGVIVSQLLKDNLMEAVDIQQLESFQAGCLFAQAEGIIPAPESCHAIAAAIREANQCKESGEEKVILFNLSGHGLIDMASYDQYLAGNLMNYELKDEDIQKNLDGIITVDDEELVVAFLDMVENHKMIVENSGLLTVAALKQLDVKDKKIVSILSGGNMDVITMSSVVQQGLVQRSRIFTVSVLLPDKPGELVRVASIIAEANGNVIKLEHNQFVSINRKATVELRITIEAFGHEHKDEIVDKLEAAGLRPRIVKVNI